MSDLSQFANENQHSLLGKREFELAIRDPKIEEILLDDYCLDHETLDNLRANRVHLVNGRMRFTHLKNLAWRECTLEQVELDRVDASGAVIRLCRFQRVNIDSANFNDARLENCDMQGCSFDGSNFVNASLTDSDFVRASFKNANLSNANASYCNMRGADFTFANLIGTNFQDTDLRGADFRSAKLESVGFDGADLTGAVFDEEVMTKYTSSNESTAAFRDMVGALGPTVSGLLNKAGEQGLLDSDSAHAELEEVMKSIGTSGLNTSSGEKFDETLGSILSTVSNVGIEPLLDALQQQGNKPSEVVAEMLEGLSVDMNMDKNATAEELLSALVSKFTDK